MPDSALVIPKVVRVPFVILPAKVLRPLPVPFRVSVLVPAAVPLISRLVLMLKACALLLAFSALQGLDPASSWHRCWNRFGRGRSGRKRTPERRDRWPPTPSRPTPVTGQIRKNSDSGFGAVGGPQHGATRVCRCEEHSFHPVRVQGDKIAPIRGAGNQATRQRLLAVSVTDEDRFLFGRRAGDQDPPQPLRDRYASFGRQSGQGVPFSS